ncbi:MAG: NUDIX hydrolase [Flavobacteriales bacterium]
MYKVYFLNRPVTFTNVRPAAKSSQRGISIIQSHGKMDTMHIEASIKSGAKEVFVICEDIGKSWSAFIEQFELVQAAGGLVLNDEKKMLFIYRLEKWDLPKGKVEDDEEIEEGALREVEEECSIDELKLLKLICTTWHTYMQKGEPILKATAWYLMQYHGTKKPTPQTIEGITETRWLAMDELDMVRANTYPSVLDVVETYASLPVQ